MQILCSSDCTCYDRQMRAHQNKRFTFLTSSALTHGAPPLSGSCTAGDATVKGYTKLINKTGAYTEIANNGTDEKRCKE